MALHVNRRNIIAAIAPGGPNPQPAKAVSLQVLEVFANEFLRRSQSSIITYSQQECRPAIDGELGSINSQHSPGKSWFGEKARSSQDPDCRALPWPFHAC